MEIGFGHKESGASFISTQCPAHCASQTEKALSLLQLKDKTKQNVPKESPSPQSRTNVTGCGGITLKSQHVGDGGRNIKGSRVPELHSKSKDSLWCKMRCLQQVSNKDESKINSWSQKHYSQHTKDGIQPFIYSGRKWFNKMRSTLAMGCFSALRRQGIRQTMLGYISKVL